MNFITQLLSSDTPFLLSSLICGLLASISFGVIGSFVVTKKITSLAGSISHCVLGGVGIGLFISYKLHASAGSIDNFATVGALVSAILAALILGTISLYSKEREDTLIGALWALGMSVGLIFIAKVPGQIDPMSYLFGNILLISARDIYLIAGLDVIVIISTILFYNRFLAICFDEEFARLKSINVIFHYLFLLCLVSLTVVLLMSTVGIILVIALLTLPAACAGIFSKKLSHMMIIGTLLCMIFNFVGLALSFEYNLPTGPSIVIVSSLTFVVLLLGRSLLKR